MAGAISQARLMAARAEWDAADRLLDDLAGALPLLQAPWGMPRIRAEQAHLAVRRGDLGAARTWLAELDLTGDRDPPFGREPEAIVLARARIRPHRVDCSETNAPRDRTMGVP